MFSDKINSIIEYSRKKFQCEAKYEEQKRHLHEQEHKKRVDEFKRLMIGKLKKATTNDYNNWLKGYLGNGGTITHKYDYPTLRWNWYVVLSDFEISPLYGSESLNIIVPLGIKCLKGEGGHTNLFYMDGFTTINNFAPIFSDTKLEE